MPTVRACLAVVLASVVGLGTAAPAHAGFLDFLHGRDDPVEEPAPNPLPYAVTLNTPGAERQLRRALENASGLLERADSPPSGLGGLMARARQDIGRMTGVLYQNAYYAGQIDITINGRSIDTIGAFDDIGTVPADVVVDVDTGQPFVFGSLDVGPLPPGVVLEQFGLETGEPARSAVVLRTQRGIVEAWQEQGHPFAEATQRDTVADHDTRCLDVTIRFNPGPVAGMGAVRVEGAEDVDPALIAGRANLTGRPYSVTAINRAERRLRDLGPFASVRITHEEELAPDGTVTMIVTVAERKKRVIGFGASYSSSEGAAVEAYWRHRNLFGGAERLEFSGELSRLLDDTLDPDYRFAGRFTKPGVHDPLTDLILGAATYRETTEAYRVTATEAEVGISRIFSDTLKGAVTLSVAGSETIDANDEVETHIPLTLTGRLDWDSTDDRLDPSEGHRAHLVAAPSYDLETSATYARFSTGVSHYRALDDAQRFVIAGRAATSILTVDDIETVAPDQRLYTGGASTVRGYAYKNIAPRDAEGDLVGGRSSVLLSGELRWRVTDQWGAVAFVDAGNAYSSITPDVTDLKIGIGAGVRYFTPVGPIRLDVAVPLQPESGDPSVAIHVGLGQAF